MAKIWITGAKGFIGRNLAEYLSHRSCSVYGLGHGAWPKKEFTRQGLTFWQNGEVEGSNLARLFEKSGPPEYVYHLAGGSSIGPSFASPLEDFRRTVESTAFLLDWVNQNSPETGVICASSGAVYGVGHAAKIDEESPLSPCSPYGTHKLIMESLCQSYIRNFGARIAIVRLFSVYGSGLEKQLIWDICSKLSAGESPVPLGGTGQEIRDWLHVSDAVTLLWAAKALCGSPNPVVNGGTGKGTSVRGIAERVCDEWGNGAKPDFSGNQRPGNPEVLVADTKRAEALGFSVNKPLQEGLREFVVWFKARKEN